MTDPLKPLDVRCDHQGNGMYWCDLCKPTWRCLDCCRGIQFGEAAFNTPYCPHCGGELEAVP